jgi:hypothetical protein
MYSWLVWLVFVIVCVLLGFVGYHFSVRTLRFVTALLALAVVVTVTRYGVTHQAAGSQTNLVNSFTRGFDDLIHAFLQPLLGHNNPLPGPIGWLAIIALLVFAYRELEVWAMRWQPPTVDTSALGGDQQAAQDSGAPGGQAKVTTDQKRQERVVNELRFRLPAVAVRSPAILPGGSKMVGIASIAESTGNSAGGLAGAIIGFAGTLWPNPRQYQVRVRVEPAGSEDQANCSTRVTVDLEDTGRGASVATRTLAAGQLDDAASVVAGYVARQIFNADPTAPPWCYGSLDGGDLAAMLIAWQERVYPKSADDIRCARIAQMNILERAPVCSGQCAGVLRYELALLHDLGGYHVEALRLHAINREQYPRFYRGWYRLGMSLEMIANPKYVLLGNKAKQILCESLDTLHRCGITRHVADKYLIEPGKPLPPDLRQELLVAAQQELRKVRRQLTLWRIIWAAFVHRDERAIWQHYWRLQERQRFHDGARVAELLATVRLRLLEIETDGGHPWKISYNMKRAINITTAITGDSAAIETVFTSEDKYEPDPNLQPGRHAQRTRWAPWQCSTPSWQAAYNAACLYAALADIYGKDEMAPLVTASLKRSVNDRYCEMERPSDWISEDPDFLSVKSSDKFQRFLGDQKLRDHPEMNPAPAHR